jgi:chemotaxis protein CheD
METVVRMGEAWASNAAGDVLACIGLGSCVGLALIDRANGVAALAHVMLPASVEPPGLRPHKFADLCVPALIDLALAHGAARRRLEAAIAGGAAMFQFGGSGQDIGGRNAAALMRLLHGARIPVRANATGGGRGRTMRVALGGAISITVREAGGREEQLLGCPTAGKAVLA